MAGERDKVLSFLGLARKAGKIASGEFQTEEAVKKGRASAVILAEDASDNTKKKFRNMCEWHNVRVFCYSDRETLGSAVGCGARSSLAVTDPGFASVIIKALGQDAGRERRY